MSERERQSGGQPDRQWRELIGPFTHTEGALARLGGIPHQELAERAAHRHVLSVVTSDAVRLYPLWQFAPGGGLIAGMAEVLSQFRDADLDDWTLAAWFCSDDPDLGEAPCDVLLRGEVERVLTAGRAARRNLTA